MPPTHQIDKSLLLEHPHSRDRRPGMVAPYFDLEAVDLVLLEQSQEFLRRHKPEQPSFCMSWTTCAPPPPPDLPISSRSARAAGSWQLHDLSTDPGERKSLDFEEPAVAARLKGMLVTLKLVGRSAPRR
ncbi:MAG: hypothetical protein O2816_17185 [Planctomycetota bacterium]|nr:hypothetical protein [Planctomycetota bacterium]